MIVMYGVAIDIFVYLLDQVKDFKHCNNVAYSIVAKRRTLESR